MSVNIPVIFARVLLKLFLVQKHRNMTDCLLVYISKDLWLNM